MSFDDRSGCNLVSSASRLAHPLPLQSPDLKLSVQPTALPYVMRLRTAFALSGPSQSLADLGGIPVMLHLLQMQIAIAQARRERGPAGAAEGAAWAAAAEAVHLLLRVDPAQRLTAPRLIRRLRPWAP